MSSGLDENSPKAIWTRITKEMLSLFWWYGWFDSFWKAESSKDSSKSSSYLWKPSFIRQLNILDRGPPEYGIHISNRVCLISLFIGSKFSILNLFISRGSFVFQIWVSDQSENGFVYFYWLFHQQLFSHKWHFDRVYWFLWKLY